ncbi:hypothetical protein V8E54_007250 [Elaphomyces granulatus]
MSKRCRNNEIKNWPSSKRLRVGEPARHGGDRLSTLSDEIILYIFSFLPIPSLIVCQRLSRRFHDLAGDSELWKRLYYSRWVLPRTHRLPLSKRSTVCSNAFSYSPRVSKWLGHGHLAQEGQATNWKKKYRLRHNWSRGICRVSEIEVAEPPQPSMLVTLYAGIVLTVDGENGLRGWSAKNPKLCLARVSFSSGAVPTALSSSSGCCPGIIPIVVGFEDGQYKIYDLDVSTSHFTLRCSHTASADGAITAVASSPPYLLVLTNHKVLSLYELPAPGMNANSDSSTPLPRFLASLEANNIFSPLCLSIRVSTAEIVASIAYSFCRIGGGWSLGIQELHLSQDGEHLGSRLATTVDCQYGKDHDQMQLGSVRTKNMAKRTNITDDRYATMLAAPLIQHHEPPTSLSYSHPYLLTSHGDNTLTMYAVVSTSDQLVIKGARRLWGHTSSVVNVQVSDRGKAVSMSSCGGELRIWELETMLSCPPSSTRALKSEHSIQVSPENQRRKSDERRSLADALVRCRRSKPEGDGGKKARMRGLIGFDEEQVVVLHEKGAGIQLLEYYDFT